MTTHASHVVLFLTEQLATQSTTPLIPYVSTTTTGRRTPDGTEQGVDANISNDNAQAAFLRSSRVTRMGTLETTFFMDENRVPIKIEEISSIYTLFNLLFVI